MSDRVRGWLLAAWAASVVGVLALNVLWPLPGEEDSWPWVGGLMAFPVAAAIVLARRPHNVIGRLLGLTGMSAGAIFVMSWYAVAHPDAPLSRQVEALETIPAVLQFGGILGLLHLFPSGRPVNRYHAWAITALWWWVGISAVVGVVAPGPMILTERENPFGLGPLWLRDLYGGAAAVLVPYFVLGFWAVVARWRRAEAVERAQLKWFFAGATWVLVVVLLMALTPEDPPDPTVTIVASTVVMSAFWSLPAAVVIAITRYRLFDIDRIVSRTIGYALVAGVLALVYAGSVVGLQAVLPVGGSDLAVAGSTLAAAALFRPVRGRLQRAVDRRFNRARYEAALVTQEFAERLRREVDLDAVTHDMSGVVVRTMQPASAGVWLRPGRA